MFCTNCGSEIPSGARFCVQCGEPVHAVGVTEPTSETHTQTQAPTYSTPPQSPETAVPAAPKRRKGLIAVLVLVAVLAVAGIGAFVLLGGSHDDSVTASFASEDSVAVTSTARLIPLSSEGTPLERYVVRIKSAVDGQGEEIDLSGAPEELEFSGSGGFTMEDLIPGVDEGTYLLEIDDGETTHTTPPIVVDQEQGEAGDVELEPGEDQDEDDGDAGAVADPADEDEEMSDAEAEALYREVLDLFYDNIQANWEGYEPAYESEDTVEVSYLFYSYFPVYNEDSANLDTIGYQFADLDDDGIPELIVGMEGFDDYLTGVTQIIDLYTIEDGQVVHLGSSGERFGYQLCEDGSIYYWGSGGWASQGYELCELVDGELVTIETVWSEPDADNVVHWYYTPEGGSAYDSSDAATTEIDEDEATEITDGWPQRIDLTLTPFSEYSPD